MSKAKNQHLDAEGSDQLAEQILTVAEEVAREEVRIKHAILAAVDEHDFDRIRQIVQRWLDVPVADVLIGVDTDKSPSQPANSRPRQPRKLRESQPPIKAEPATLFDEPYPDNQHDAA